MDIDGGGVKRFMSEERLDGKKVGAVFIEVRAEGMTEGMAGQPVGPAKALLMGIDMAGNIEGVNRPLAAVDFREKPVSRTIIGIPVLSEDIEGVLRKDGITVGPVFAMADMDAHIFS